MEGTTGKLSNMHICKAHTKGSSKSLKVVTGNINFIAFGCRMTINPLKNLRLEIKAKAKTRRK